jgi:hypothetical protein
MGWPTSADRSGRTRRLRPSLAAPGVTISTFGLGADFDETLQTAIATPAAGPPG